MPETDLTDMNLDRGESVILDVGDDVIVIERRPKKSDWEIGDVVEDRDSDGDEKLIVVHPSDEVIEDVSVGGINVANANKSYPKDDTAVYCIYLRQLIDSIGGIPEDLEMLFRDGKFRVLNVKAYAYPSTRLEDVEDDWEHEEE